MSKRPHRLHFSDLGRDIAGNPDESIFANARRQGVRIVGACGGRGACGSCLVRIAEGRVEGHDGEGRDWRKKWQRACRVAARSDCVVEIAPRSLAPVARAEVEADRAETLDLDPRVRAVDVTLAEASLEDPSADAERLMRALPAAIDRIELAAARALPALLRGNRWSVRARIRDDAVISVAKPGSRTLGLAVDLGTTNVAAFLIDLESGGRLAGIGIENPQAAWGADVISRINYAVKTPGGGEELRIAIVAGLNALAHDLCHAVGLDKADIVDAVICGNAAMHHLLTGLPVHQLGKAPFVAAVQGGMDVRASDLGIAICPDAQIHLVANIGGFVGGDHVTALLATEERWRTGTSLVMDIGTNTEISLIHNGRLISASCPSGPALEGGHISCGMRAAQGAIERVTEADGRIAVKTIGGLAPVGLCGSGVLDALAAFHQAGIVDDRGRIAAHHPDVAEIDGKRAVVLAPGVYFTQDDVRAVQLAKAAIRTGTELLLREAGLQESDIARFIIAGAFGSYIDVKSGIAIGLFPDLPADCFEQVGNAAGLGVRRMLASKKDLARADQLATACRYVELSSNKEFQKTFLSCIGFPADSALRKAS